MKMKQLKIIISLLYLLLYPSALSAQIALDSLRFRQINTAEGLPNNMIHQIIQDTEGYIWIASYFGLYRYDGNSYQAYKSSDDTPGLLPSNNILCIAEDRRHRLWIGTENGLCILDKTTGRLCSRNITNISKQRLNHIHITPDGEIYLGYIRGLVYYDQPNDSLILLNRENCRGEVPVQVNIQAIAQDKNGDLLIGTWKDGLYRYSPKYRHFIHYTTLPGDQTVLSIRQDSYGNTWLGSGGSGLHKVTFSADHSSLFIETFPPDLHTPDALPSGYIYTLLDDPSTQSLWLGTRDGISIMDYKAEGHFFNYHDHPQAGVRQLPVYEVHTIFKDSNHRKWIGCKGAGIFRSDTKQPPFNMIFPRNARQTYSDYISTIFVDEDDACWAGFSYGVDYLKGKQRRTILRSDRPYHISYSRSTGEVLIATHDRGFYSGHQAEISHHYRKGNCRFVPDNLVFTVYEDRQGNWWTGTYKGVGVRYKDGRQYCLNKFPGADSSFAKEISCIAEDDDCHLWLIAQNNEVIRVSGDLQQPDSLRCSSYTLAGNRLPAGTPQCFHTDRQGHLWLGMEGSGLCRYDPAKDRFISCHKAYGLPCDMVASIETDSYGRLWLGTGCGLACLTIDPDGNGRAKIFTTADGLADNFFHRDASCVRNGTFYFGSSRGIVTFRPDEITDKTSCLPFLIADFTINGQCWNDTPTTEKGSAPHLLAPFMQELTLTSPVDALSFHFTALTYDSEENCRFAYRLIGQDSTWQLTALNRQQADFRKLPAGNYTFEAYAVNGNGDKSELRTIALSIRQPWWQSPWAWIIYLPIGAGVLWIALCFFRRRVSRKTAPSLPDTEIPPLQYTDPDEKFLQEATACVNRHLSDPDFDITRFTEELSISRSSLHNKLVSLTGMNTSAFIRSTRLKAARSFISENPGIRITDLAYQVGFNDPKYFSACFKKEFGVLPSEWSSQQKTDTRPTPEVMTTDKF